MVQIKALAQTIQEELNGNLNAVALGLNFKIHASVGNFKKAMSLPQSRVDIRVKQGVILNVFNDVANIEFEIENISNFEVGTRVYYEEEEYCVASVDYINNKITLGVEKQKELYSKVADKEEYTLTRDELFGQKTKFINGVLKSSSGSYTPVSGLNNLFISLMLELAVPQEKAEDFELVASSWSEDVIGSIYHLNNWDLLITPKPATPGTVKNVSPIGSTIPYLIMLDIQFIKNGMISNSVEWKINGQEVRPEAVSISWNMTPHTVPIANDGLCRTENQYLSETITLILPYSLTTVMQTLFNDLVAHNYTNTYNIIRQDSFANNLVNNYKIANATINEEAEKIVSLTVTFSPAL